MDPLIYILFNIHFFKQHKTPTHTWYTNKRIKRLEINKVCESDFFVNSIDTLKYVYNFAIWTWSKTNSWSKNGTSMFLYELKWLTQIIKLNFFFSWREWCCQLSEHFVVWGRILIWVKKKNDIFNILDMLW